MFKRACLMALLAFAAGCGKEPPPAAEKPAPTVFDPLLEKKQSVPAAVDAAQQQHDAEARKALDAAEGAPPGEAKR